MKSGIYKIENLTNAKVYIGSTVNIENRVSSHLSTLKSKTHKNDKLQKSFNKHGIDNFEFKVLIECAPEHLLMYEQVIIDFYDAVKNGYNINPIAGICMLGKKHTEESKQKMRDAWAKRKGLPKKKFSEETKLKISESKKGKKRKPFTEEAKKNMSLSKVGNKNRLGIPHTEEAKEKMKLTRNLKKKGNL